MIPQPIETGPHDGTHILAANLNQANPIWTAVHWFDEGWYLSVNELELHAGWQCDRLTHWLPQPPTSLERSPSDPQASVREAATKCIQELYDYSIDISGEQARDIEAICKHFAGFAHPAPVSKEPGEAVPTDEILKNEPPMVPDVLAPVYKFLMERCHYWQPIFDDESLPPVGWKGVVEAETKRGHIEYRQAEYKAPLFGGPASWAAWTFREEGDWKPLRWLKKWDLKIGVYTGPPPHDDAGADKSAGVPMGELEELAEKWRAEASIWEFPAMRGLLKEKIIELHKLISHHQDPHHG